jgi:hypothetical protein
MKPKQPAQYVVIFLGPDLHVGPFPSEDAANDYLADFPRFYTEDVLIERLRAPRDYPAPTPSDFRPDVP